MSLTPNDLKAIGDLFDERTDAKIDGKFDQKLNQRLAPVYDFIEFAKTALLSLLEESEEHFKQRLRGHHAS